MFKEIIIGFMWSNVAFNLLNAFRSWDHPVMGWVSLLSVYITLPIAVGYTLNWIKETLNARR